MPKRVIDIGYLLNECPKVHDELVCRGLGVFFEEPDEANLAVVREFYANFPKHEDYACTVGRKQYNFRRKQSKGPIIYRSMRTKCLKTTFL